ncbi:MAG: GTPase HflX [Dehalococcoidia bacterium]|nr:GTPase HflX [Dehalococcoidia bacterium]
MTKAKQKTIPTYSDEERAFLVGVGLKGKRPTWSVSDSLDELAQLASTAGADVVGITSQQLERQLPTYLGKGKIEELKDIRSKVYFDTIICDDELTPTQQRNLEQAFSKKGTVSDLKVIDRAALILDVFAKHAQTREGRLQVELAQAEYLLPRLAGQWSHLERLGGGIGTRGPGETQIETDRRLATRRIQKLKSNLEAIRKHREQYRRQRQRSGIPMVSLVGYTNAGKSTLLNALGRAEVTAKDQLFSTLDPVTRRINLPNGTQFLLTDTVGFIQKLPPALVAAFRATLEELFTAEILIHVVDISHPNAPEHVNVVEDVLRDLNVDSKSQIIALNKVDLLNNELDEELKSNLSSFLKSSGVTAVVTSAETGLGLNELLKAIQNNVKSVPNDELINL